MDRWKAGLANFGEKQTRCGDKADHLRYSFQPHPSHDQDDQVVQLGISLRAASIQALNILTFRSTLPQAIRHLICSFGPSAFVPFIALPFTRAPFSPTASL